MIGQLFASFLEDGILYQHFDRRMSYHYPRYSKPVERGNNEVTTPTSGGEMGGGSATTPTKQEQQWSSMVTAKDSRRLSRVESGIGSLLQLLGANANNRTATTPMTTADRLNHPASSVASPSTYFAREEDRFTAQTINLDAALLMLETLRCPSDRAALAAAANLGTTYGSMHEASYAYSGSMAGPSGTPSPTILGSRWYAGLGNGSAPSLTPLQTPLASAHFNGNPLQPMPPPPPPSTPMAIIPLQPTLVERLCHIPDVAASTIQTLIPSEGLALYAFEPPALPLADYIEHLMSHMPCDIECFVLALALVIDASKVEEEEDQEGRDASRSYFCNDSAVVGGGAGPATGDDAFDRCPSPPSFSYGAAPIGRRVSISPAKQGSYRMGPRAASGSQFHFQRDKAAMESSALLESVAAVGGPEGEAYASFGALAVLSTNTFEGVPPAGEASTPPYVDESVTQPCEPAPAASTCIGPINGPEEGPSDDDVLSNAAVDMPPGPSLPMLAQPSQSSGQLAKPAPPAPSRSILLSSSLSFIGGEDNGGPIAQITAMEGSDDTKCVFFDEDSDDGHDGTAHIGTSITSGAEEATEIEEAPAAAANGSPEQPAAEQTYNAVTEVKGPSERQPSKATVAAKKPAAAIRRKKRPKTKNEETNANNYLLLCTRSVHRVFLAALVVCMKMRNDKSSRMSSYSSIGGLTSSDLRGMEVAFLSVLNFDARVSVGYYLDLLYSLRSHCTSLVYERNEAWAAAAWGALFKRLPLPSVASLTSEIAAANEQAAIERHRYLQAKHSEDLKVYTMKAEKGPFGAVALLADPYLGAEDRAGTPSPVLAPVSITGTIGTSHWDPKSFGDEDEANLHGYDNNGSITVRNDTVAAIIECDHSSQSAEAEGSHGPPKSGPLRPIDTFLPVPGQGAVAGDPAMLSSTTPLVTANTFSSSLQEGLTACLWDSASTISCRSSAAGTGGSGGTEAPRSAVASGHDRPTECKGEGMQLSPPVPMGEGM